MLNHGTRYSCFRQGNRVSSISGLPGQLLLDVHGLSGLRLLCTRMLQLWVQGRPCLPARAVTFDVKQKGRLALRI